MLKRLFAIALIVIFSCSLFTACGEEESINVIYPISADPECLDPQIVENQSAKLIVSNCMEGLVRISESGEIVPGVAKTWSVSADGLTYTFSLRSDSVWQMLRSHSKVLGEDYKTSFSTKVTAYDCAFGIERALRPETKAKEAYLLFPIKNAEKFNNGEVNRDSLGIEAKNEETLIIHLERAYPDLLRVLTQPMCMPCDQDFFNASGAKYGLESKFTLCNGPFYVGRWVDDGSLTLYSNENYSGYTSYKTSAVYLYVNGNENQYLAKFNQGDYNIASLSPENLKSVNSSADIHSSKTGVYGFLFNCEDSVLSNPDMRKALVNSIDISLITKDLPNYDVYPGVVPDCCRWGNDSYRNAVGSVSLPEFNSQKSIELFSKAVKQDDVSNISISIICPENFKTGIIRMIQKWEKLFGLAITVSVSSLEEEELERSVKHGEYQIAFTCLESENDNPLMMLNTFTSENESNFALFSDLNYDNLIENCKKTNSGNSIAFNYKTAEEYLINQGVFYPVFSNYSYFVSQDSARDCFGYSAFSLIDFAMWSETENE